MLHLSTLSGFTCLSRIANHRTNYCVPVYRTSTINRESSEEFQTMSALPYSLPSVHNQRSMFRHGSTLVQVDNCLSSSKQFLNPVSKGKRRSLTVQASKDEGRSSGASIFVGGFVLGGIVVGALGCIYAPQLSEALSRVDRKDLMRKLPKFIYDEEKALERTRKILTEKIAQLNTAIDEVYSQLRQGQNDEEGVAKQREPNKGELEASI